MSGPHKKGGHEEGGGHAPMWIVSFADMVILLMSFFVLLLCQGSQKKTSDEDLLRMLASVKANFGYTPKPNSKDPLDMAVLQVLSQKQKGGFLGNAQKWKSPSVKSQVTKERDNWVKAQSAIGKPFLFAKNSAKISDLSQENLEEIAAVVRHHFRMVVIQAHCSDDEAASDAMDGDDLAFRRAIAVKDVLKKHGVAAWRMRPVICSSHESPKTLKSADRQIVIVTLGSYYLPSDHDVIDEGKIPAEQDAAPAKSSGHGGH